MEKERTTHSSILAWEIPWTGEPEGIQCMVLQRVGHDGSDLAHTQILYIYKIYVNIYVYIYIYKIRTIHFLKETFDRWFIHLKESFCHLP